MKAFSMMAAALAAAVAIAACTVHQTETPPLTGPSMTAQGVTLTASPDTITQNGSSQSVITLLVRGPNGEPLSNQPFRLDIFSGGVAAPSFGTLSATQVVTGSDGRATATFTSPTAPPNGAILGTCAPGLFVTNLPGPCITIMATPVSNAFLNNSTPVQIHLVPKDVVHVPGAPFPSFTFSPAAPKAGDEVFFNASGSTGDTGRTLVNYEWDFGDGSHLKFGVSTNHDYAGPGSYFVTLTVTDDRGTKASATNVVNVS